MKVVLKDIVDALEAAADEHYYFLDRQTGKVEFVSREVLGIAEEGGTIDDVLQWQEDQFGVAEAIFADWDRFEKLPTKFDIHEWDIMRAFAESVVPRNGLAAICKMPSTAAARRSGVSRIRCAGTPRKGMVRLPGGTSLRDLAIEWCQEKRH